MWILDWLAFKTSMKIAELTVKLLQQQLQNRHQQQLQPQNPPLEIMWIL